MGLAGQARMLYMDHEPREMSSSPEVLCKASLASPRSGNDELPRKWKAIASHVGTRDAP